MPFLVLSGIVRPDYLVQVGHGGATSLRMWYADSLLYYM